MSWRGLARCRVSAWATFPEGLSERTMQNRKRRTDSCGRSPQSLKRRQDAECSSGGAGRSRQHLGLALQQRRVAEPAVMLTAAVRSAQSNEI